MSRPGSIADAPRRRAEGEAPAKAPRVAHVADVAAGPGPRPSARPTLDVASVVAGHRGVARPAVDRVTVRVRPGVVAGLIGPNGSGKSTLLRTIHRDLRPRSGAILVDGRDAWTELSRDGLAREVAVLGQDAGAAPELRAIDVVRTGRLPHQSVRRESIAAQEVLALEALGRVGAGHLAERRMDRLSGGERQRVLLARAIVQDGGILLLDEPGNHLDLRAQLDVLGLVARHGGTVLAVMHDLNLAAAVCDELHVLRDGRLVASGATADVLTPGLVAEVFGVEALVDENPLTGRPRVTLGGAAWADRAT